MKIYIITDFKRQLNMIDIEIGKRFCLFYFI